MIAELKTLHALLIAAMIVAPAASSRFFLQPSRLYDGSHAVALGLTTAGLLFDSPLLCFAWLLFCILGFGRLLRQRFAHLLAVDELAIFVPYTFSLIGATWLVSGANGYGLLGYGKPFSYYAALHAHVVGWMVVGGLTFLANRAEQFRRVFLLSVFICFGSFLLIAFGIDGVTAIKPIGVAGLTVGIAVSQLLFLFIARKKSALVVALASLSVLGFLFTMTLAWQNELEPVVRSGLFGTRAMVSLHGLVNGVVVAPSFCLALYLGYVRDQQTSSDA